MKFVDFHGSVHTDISLARFTTWRIGGPSDWMIMPSNMDDLDMVLAEIRRIRTPWFILGNGSNVLFSDNGFRGVIITLGTGFKRLSISGEMVQAGAGVMLNHLAQQTASAGLSGLEPLAGIPGTLGGAAAVNAGAFGSSLLDRCTVIKGIDSSGIKRTYTNILSDYRSRKFPADFIITELQLKLTPDDPSRIHEQIFNYLEKRRSTQPLSEASAGCTFKNPDSRGAGRLIDELGLKGFQNGRAMISTKHANFIINTGEASSADVIGLIEIVRRRVWEAFKVKLELEVIVLDEYGHFLDPGRDLE
ncbi:MAG: UDP-N-acetylmuramate dehydrogenase [bacterium]